VIQFAFALRCASEAILVPITSGITLPNVTSGITLPNVLNFDSFLQSRGRWRCTM